jgi:hypothetical protein
LALAGACAGRAMGEQRCAAFTSQFVTMPL